jgi:hypothetical protein
MTICNKRTLYFWWCITCVVTMSVLESVCLCSVITVGSAVSEKEVQYVYWRTGNGSVYGSAHSHLSWKRDAYVCQI